MKQNEWILRAGAALGLWLLLCILPVAAQLTEFESEETGEARKFLGVIGGQITSISGEEPSSNLNLVFNGYIALSDGGTTGLGMAVLTGGLGRRDLVYFGISGVHYFSDEFGRGLFVQFNAGLAQLYENIITFNRAPGLAFGSYVSAGYSLEFSHALPALQIGVVQGLFTFERTYKPFGLQACIVF